MRLGFHYHLPAAIKNGGISMPAYLGRFIDGLGEHCETITCFLHPPRPSEMEMLDYQLTSSNVTLVDIGERVSVPKRTIFAKSFTKHINDRVDSLDIMLIRGPSPLLPMVAKASSNIPVTLLLVGDYLQVVDEIPQPWWRKEAIRLWCKMNTWQQKQVIRESLVFVNSSVLARQVKPFAAELKEVRTTTLFKDDFFQRQDTCQENKIKLLYTGRLDSQKGIYDIAEAVAILDRAGITAEFGIAGWEDSKEPVLKNAINIAAQYGLEERIVFYGKKTVGPDLFGLYHNADIFVTASRASEGFPRTIWEAMSQSTPVVATKVGSIPELLEDSKHAMLAEPRSPESLAQAISKIVQDRELRQSLITNGYKIASASTLEENCKIMADCMKDWVLKNKATNE